MRRKVAVMASLVVLAPACGDSAAPTTSSPPATQAAAAVLPFAGELQGVLDVGMESPGAVGVSAAVVVPGFEPWVGVAGFSDPTTGEVMRPEMMFDIGSVTKNFTAALMLLLAEGGAFSLDDPIGDWVTGYPQVPAEVTLRQLVGMQSGIADWVRNPESPFRAPGGVGGPGALDVVEWDKLWTLDDLLTTLVGDPVFLPGEGWQYSNTNYSLARHVVEQATGKPMSEVTRNRLMEPLGLDGTFVEFDQPIPSDVVFAHPWTYDFDSDGSPDDFGGRSHNWLFSLLPILIYSDAEDLAGWCAALFTEGKVLSDASLAEMLTFVPADDPGEELAAAYGLGVGKFNPEFGFDPDHYGHLGQSMAYETMMVYIPEHEACVVAMVNNVGGALATAGIPLITVVDQHLSATG